MQITPHKDTLHWEVILHGDVKKLDTQIVDQKEPGTPSGSVCPGLAEVDSTKESKGTIGIINDSSILLAKTNPFSPFRGVEGDAIAQAPKQETLGHQKALNPGNRGTRDATASTETDKRTRSQHSIANPGEKAGSAEILNPKREILEHKLYRVVLRDLNKYKTSEGQYNGIIRIIDSMMLKTCYSLIKSKPGNMTLGAEDITLDGIDLKWFEKTAKDIQEGRFKFSPARQILNPKPNKPGELRPLLIASPREKIVLKALQVLLNAIYVLLISKTSNEFKPDKDLVDAHDRILKRGGLKAWEINGDFTKCFDRIPLDIILTTIKKGITCARTLTLIERVLKAGLIVDKGDKTRTKIGTPQGSKVSPFLSNIVLDKLDKYIEELDDEINIGVKRKRSLEYDRKEGSRKQYKTKDPILAREYLMKMRLLPKFDTRDENYRRGIYVRYADDFVMLLASKREREFAISLKEKIATFLKESCGLEQNDAKTTITKTREGFMFLGAEIKKRDNSSLFNSNSFEGAGGNKITRRSPLRMGVVAPIKLLVEKLIQHGFARRNHRAEIIAKGKTEMIHLTHYEIIRFYNSKITGLLDAYRLAGNFSGMNRVIWILRQSCALTLARKLKLKTKAKAVAKFGPYLEDPSTGVSLNIPETYKATYDYYTSPLEICYNPEKTVENILRTEDHLGLKLKKKRYTFQLCNMRYK
uniref:Reverse transcriptase domain-containing protein n=1 Tax=Termitomyces sp. TaxID=1916073 RepID=A0A386TYN6_9AGAR|nr:hypothetical protein C0992_000045 [Termitomyces sp.]